MSEQRLIDSNADVYPYVTTWTCNCSEYGVQNVMAVDDISTLPEIDPETLPLVKELRKKIEELEDRNRMLAFQNLTSESSLENIALRAALQAAEKELRKVTAERDAAVEDLQKLVPAWKWDGLQEDENEEEN